MENLESRRAVTGARIYLENFHGLRFAEVVLAEYGRHRAAGSGDWGPDLTPGGQYTSEALDAFAARIHGAKRAACAA